MDLAFKKSTAVFLLTVFVIICAAGAAAAFQQYRDYRDKMDILHTMVGTEQVQNEFAKKRADAASGSGKGVSGSESDETAPQVSSYSADTCLDAAVGLLKGKKSDSEIGKGLMRSYGYTDELLGSGEDENYYRRQLYISWAVTAAACLAAYFAVCCLWISQTRQRRREYQCGLYEVADILSDLQAEEHYSLQRDLISCGDDAWDVLYDRLVSLTEYLQYMRENSAKERESTKSLVTDLSHQLKTPVAALGMSLEILKQDDLTEEERGEFTERCLAQKDRLQELLSALFNISRLESGLIEIHYISARIFDTVAAAVSRIYPIAVQKDIEISVDAEYEIHDLKIGHDVKWLCEAFLNVLENAVKYSPQKSAVQIRMSKRTTFLRIEIEDEGIGIPKEERHRVFQRFYRGRADEVVLQPGSGVGLYLTRQIIERHGGTIRAASGKNRGSIFIIQLPYAGGDQLSSRSRI